MRLDGCVNDAFLMSGGGLQESGFEPEHIRTVFDDRATAANLRDRLAWLLDDTEPGDQRVLFYSGHGPRSLSMAPTPRSITFRNAWFPTTLTGRRSAQSPTNFSSTSTASFPTRRHSWRSSTAATRAA